MAWRPTRYLLEGELDNTHLGRVTGWMRFAGMKEKMTFELVGDFHRDIRGAKIRFVGDGKEDDSEAAGDLHSFAQHQTGKVGDITAGLPPQDYVDYPYIEWYGDQNGRVVIELERGQIEVIGEPIPADICAPISRQERQQNMADFLAEMAQALDVPLENAICVGPHGAVSAAQSTAMTPKPRSVTLLSKADRARLPPLCAQDSKGGDAVAYVKFFTPDAGWTWYATEFDGQDTFFGLVDGHDKELGFFSLSELEQAHGPMGLPVERDRYWQPKTLKEIAPKAFARKRPAP